MAGEIDFPARGKHFSSPFFRDSCEFFLSSRKAFFNEILHSGWWKRIFWLLEIFWFPQSFSSVENVSEINGSQYLKKDHILTNEN